MVMPVFALLALLVSWVCIAGIWQLRLEDAARSITRGATMHIQENELRAQLQLMAPAAVMTLNDVDAHHIKVSITRSLDGPGILPDLTLHAQAVGRLEEND